ncbi:MAG: sensor histidine kinase [Solirubrobacterales bacterium]
MKSNTIKSRILKYNIAAIILLILLTAIIFNFAVNLYIQKNIIEQLENIASNTEITALEHGPDFFPPPDQPDNIKGPNPGDNKLFGYYLMLDRSLKEPLSLLNADFILLDSNAKRINPFTDKALTQSSELLNSITEEIKKSNDYSGEKSVSFNISGVKYIAVIKPVFDKNSFGLGWIIIYSSLKEIYQLQIGLNIILLIILIFSALVITLFSSILSQKITEPFISLNHNIKEIAERNFSSKIRHPVYGELEELVTNINIMSDKLETYDKAQKTFLQNASHEFRTPLMSIQGYAEGIKYKVVDENYASNIILDETKRMTDLVEDILYLSRLDSIEENYHFNTVSCTALMHECIERMKGAALKNNINIKLNLNCSNAEIIADEEKLIRAITNIIGNCIRYAKTKVEISTMIIDKDIEISISDDGSGFKTDELENIFERFYKGEKGNHGLGLAISKYVIEKTKGKITAVNLSTGALFKIILPLI